MKEEHLKSGRKGGVYTAKKRLVEATEDVLDKPKKIKLTVEEFEELSMEIQRELLDT